MSGNLTVFSSAPAQSRVAEKRRYARMNKRSFALGVILVCVCLSGTALMLWQWDEDPHVTRIPLTRTEGTGFLTLKARLNGKEILMAVDTAAYYAEMKKQFQSWKTLKGQERAAEVERLLKMVQGMTEPQDPEEFKRVIGPEIQQLLDEMAKTAKEASEAGFGNDVGAN